MQVSLLSCSEARELRKAASVTIPNFKLNALGFIHLALYALRVQALARALAYLVSFPPICPFVFGCLHMVHLPEQAPAVQPLPFLEYQSR